LDDLGYVKPVIMFTRIEGGEGVNYYLDVKWRESYKDIQYLEVKLGLSNLPDTDQLDSDTINYCFKHNKLLDVLKLKKQNETILFSALKYKRFDYVEEVILNHYNKEPLDEAALKLAAVTDIEIMRY